MVIMHFLISGKCLPKLTLHLISPISFLGVPNSMKILQSSTFLDE